MRPEPIYPDAKTPTSFSDGMEFQDFVVDILAEDGIVLQNYVSKKWQFEKGENRQGFEIKLDNRCTETGRLSIEIAEKSRSSNSEWVNSGIYRDDNSWLYVQGNYRVLFAFAKNWLVRFHQAKKPAEHESGGTVRKFYLPLNIAETAAAKTIWIRRT